MTISTLDPNVLAGIAAAGGAIVIKIVEKWMSKSSEDEAEAKTIRSELRMEIQRLHDENIRLEKDNQDWRQKYWELKNVHDSDEVEITSLTSIKNERLRQIEDLETVVNQLNIDVSKMRDRLKNIIE